MTGIQLIFENGIESPMLGGNHQLETMATVEIPDKPVTSVSAAMADNNFIHNIKFLQEGKEITVFSRNDNRGTLHTHEIPPNHSIVGVYGQKNGACIHKLGFIVMEL